MLPEGKVLESNGRGEEYNVTVTDLSTFPDGTLITVAIERQVIKPSL